MGCRFVPPFMSFATTILIYTGLLLCALAGLGLPTVSYGSDKVNVATLAEPHQRDAAAVSSQNPASPCGDKRVVRFLVFHEGNPAGTHVIRCQQIANRLLVSTQAEVEFYLYGIFHFTYHHTATEEWQGGRLVAFSTDTNADGKRFSVRAHMQQNGLRVFPAPATDQKPYTVTGFAIASTYWHPATDQARFLIDSQRGIIRNIEVTRLPADAVVEDTAPWRHRQPSDSVGFHMIGDLRMHYWRDQDGLLSRIHFNLRGSRFDMTRLRRPNTQPVPNAQPGGYTKRK